MAADEQVTIGGRAIAGGMIYVGQGLPGASGQIVEPALVDPSLPIDWDHPDWVAAGLDYWPSYGDIPAGSRAAYLSWLGHGRDHPDVPLGYVFLYFYGLERRLIVDHVLDHTHPEVSLLVGEVRRLLEIYGDQGSFERYATDLLDLLAAAEAYRGEIRPPDPETLAHSWEVPVAVRIALGRFVAAGQPIPAAWALTLLRSHPDVRLRTPATRCRSEFDQLFSHRYTTRFNGGMVVRPPQTNVELHYQPASAGFRRSIRTNLASIPDITTISGPIIKLQELANECTDDLDAYSRLIGRQPEAADSAVAAGLLPDDLLVSHGGAAIADLRGWATATISAGPALVVIDDVVGRWAPDKAGKLAKADAVLLATLLGRLGVGIEPDVRFGAPTPPPGSPVVLFAPPPASPDAPSATYTAAATLVHLTAVVAAADGSVSAEERQRVAEHLETILGLDDAERRRLEAHLLWLTAGRPKLTGLKKRLDALSQSQRRAIGHFLVEVAAADGQITPDEVDTLLKVYQHLGLDQADVHQAIFNRGFGESPSPSLGTSSSDQVVEPDAQAAVTGPESTSSPFQLDLARVQDRLAQTAEVTALLAGIFADDEAAIDESVSTPPTSAPILPVAGPTIGPLDVGHSALARQLADRPSWKRAELEMLAASIGLPLLDGALDRINEASYDACGEPLVEGDDPLETNQYAVEELLR